MSGINLENAPAALRAAVVTAMHVRHINLGRLPTPLRTLIQGCAILTNKTQPSPEVFDLAAGKINPRTLDAFMERLHEAT